MKKHLPHSFPLRARRVFALAFALATPIAAVQLSGCGGGSGGGSGIGFSQAEVTVTFQLVDVNGNRADGTVTLRQGSTDRTQQSINQQSIFTDVPSGNYTVLFTINGVTTQATISVATDASQTFRLTSGQSGAPNLGVTINGIARLNPTTGTTPLCTDSSTPITARLVIRVRDANGTDQPIVASMEKPVQTGNVPASQQGTFTVSNLPGPGTYFVEAVTPRPTSDDPSPTQFTGRSGSFTIANGQTSLPDSILVCTNPGTFAPGQVP